jgi:uncharacterized protein (DUF58 family)
MVTTGSSEHRAARGLPRDLLAKIRRLEIVTRRMVNEVVAGRYHSVFKGRGMEFAEVREYTIGDDVRTIDWNVTARTGAPHVKTFVEERELSVMLLVDLSGSTDFGTAGRLKSEIAAELCALLAFSAIKNNDRVGLLIFTDHVEKIIPPRKGRNHVLRVIREVLTFQPQSRGTNFPEAVNRTLRLLKRKSVVFVISDFWAGQLRRPLALLNKKHDLIALVVRDPREFSLPPVGILTLEDPETGEVLTVDTFDPYFRRRYEELVRQRHQELETMFRRMQVDFALIETNRPYVERIVRIFEKRAMRY